MIEIKPPESASLWRITSGEIAELEAENKLLRARNERLQSIIDGVVPRLASACGASAMPPTMMAEWLKGKL